MTTQAHRCLLMLLSATLTTGCSVPMRSNPNPITSSTQGSTVVRMATIIAAHNTIIVAGGEPADSGEVIADNRAAPPRGQSARTRTVTELLLRLDDGDGTAVTYQVEPSAVFQPGERVKVITRSGRTRITH
ncbi:MAG: hypothetical protein HHJ09_06350 [Glaciimonas sp.]|nr:hypothetical protein [Glaciimonas sp.]